MSTKTTLTILIAAAAFAASTTISRADVLNPFVGMGNYNAMVMGHFTNTGYGDTMGYLAVRGNATFNGTYGVGHDVAFNANAAALVVGGHVQTNGHWEVAGSAYYGSGNKITWDGQPFYYKNNGGRQGGRLSENPIDFAAFDAQFHSSSSALASLSGTDVSFAQGSNTVINAGSGQQVLNLNISDLKNGSFYNTQIYGMSDTQLLINIFGSEGFGDLIFAGGFQTFGIDPNMILFNLVDVDTMTSTNVGITASILGVDTDLSMSGGWIDGYSVFNNVSNTNGAEFHNNNGFEGGFETPPPAVTPEPATALIFGIGLLGLPVYRRLRHRKA